ncbi:MAG: hypothetical protein JZU64_05660 [Rhodoferax sp.]|nr:hypothetical protein [Rhodoferax sp.]
MPTSLATWQRLIAPQMVQGQLGIAVKLAAASWRFVILKIIAACAYLTLAARDFCVQNG